jgi:hypothetical protein
MPLSRGRPLKIAAMVESKRLAAVPAPVAPADDAASEAKRIDALTKLQALYATGVLTEEQYTSEHARLTGGI